MGSSFFHNSVQAISTSWSKVTTQAPAITFIFQPVKKDLSEVAGTFLFASHSPELSPLASTICKRGGRFYLGSQVPQLTRAHDKERRYWREK